MQPSSSTRGTWRRWGPRCSRQTAGARSFASADSRAPPPTRGTSRRAATTTSTAQQARATLPSRRRSMQVGISLLTLVPRISGGSETYARELVRSLGRVGEHSYRVLLPTIARDVEGLPSELVDEYRASTSMPRRIVGMSEGIVRGRRLRRRLHALDVVHFPLTVMIPRV